MTRTLTVRLDAETLDGLERLAQSTRRSKAFLAGQAVTEFVASQSWQIVALDEGREQIKQGRTVGAEQVKAWLRTWGTQEEAAAPRSRH